MQLNGLQPFNSTAQYRPVLTTCTCSRTTVFLDDSCHSGATGVEWKGIAGSCKNVKDTEDPEPLLKSQLRMKRCGRRHRSGDPDLARGEARRANLSRQLFISEKSHSRARRIMHNITRRTLDQSPSFSSSLFPYRFQKGANAITLHRTALSSQP